MLIVLKCILRFNIIKQDLYIEYCLDTELLPIYLFLPLQK